MKPKNVMLLGFINRAVEYLDNHMDEEPDSRLAELKNIDLASLRDELTDNLDTSLGTMQSTMATLLKAGNEAFDQYLENSKGKYTIADEIDRLFEVDLDGARKNKQQQLAKLLSFYNLESDFDEEETILPNIENVIKANSNKDKTTDDKYLQEIIKNASSNDGASNVTGNNKSTNGTAELDNVFSEIVNNEVSTKENASKVSPKYVNSLIKDLRTELKKEKVKVNENENKDVYDRISKLYPHLSNSFIRVVYDLKNKLSKEYPLDKKTIVLHRVSFKDVDNLRKFVEICLNHDYQINADEVKSIVDVFKEFVNGDGKILANIYEIANQGSVLGGNYEGYNVIINEPDE